MIPEETLNKAGTPKSHFTDDIAPNLRRWHQVIMRYPQVMPREQNCRHRKRSDPLLEKAENYRPKAGRKSGHLRTLRLTLTPLTVRPASSFNWGSISEGKQAANISNPSSPVKASDVDKVRVSYRPDNHSTFR